MKAMTVILIGLTTALLTMGFNCVNDPFLLSVNLPITALVNVDQGTTSYNESTTITLNDQFDHSYANDIKSYRVYDLKIGTIGDFSGTFSGIVYIDNTPILSVTNKAWNDFHTPQSVSGTSNLVQQNAQGIAVLLARLAQVENGQTVTVTLKTTGTISPAATSGLQVEIELLAQVDAQVSGS